MTELAEKIGRLRTQAKLTQAELAERLDVSRQTVSKWELGAAQPELDKIVAISELFGVSTDWLLKSPQPRSPGVSLDRLVLRFLSDTKDVEAISDELVGILRDGVIDGEESARISGIVSRLGAVSQMIEELQYYLTERG